MFGTLQSPLEPWKWLGNYELDLGELPVTTRQARSLGNLILGGGLSAVCIGGAIIGGYFAFASGDPADRVMLIFLLPIGLVGIGLIPLILRSGGSDRTLTFGRDGVSARGRWRGKSSAWSAGYEAYEGVDWKTEHVLSGRSIREFHVIHLRHREREKTIPLFVYAPVLDIMDEHELAERAADYARWLGVRALGRARR